VIYRKVFYNYIEIVKTCVVAIKTVSPALVDNWVFSCKSSEIHLLINNVFLSSGEEDNKSVCIIHQCTSIHLPVVRTQRRVWGIPPGALPTHVIPLHLFHSLQCFPLTGKQLHLTAWGPQREGRGRGGVGGDTMGS